MRTVGLITDLKCSVFVFSNSFFLSVYLDFSLLFIITVQFNLLKPTGHVMHQQFNIQQLYVLPTLYLCVLY
jgi:hypothetical protein